MTIAIDMIGTSLGSGTKTYNINFCKYLNKINKDQKIFIFLTKEYFKIIQSTENHNITYIKKSAIFTNIFLRILWMQFVLPFELKKLKVKQLYSPMNFGPIWLKFFKIKFTLALHSNLPWIYFSKMPGNKLRNLFTKFLMEISIHSCDKLIVDSNFAKKEIVKILKIKEEKVSVIYLGIEEDYKKFEDNNHLIENFDYQDYIISVSSCVKYHNVKNILEAFKIIKNEGNVKLKFVLVMQILDKDYFSEIKNFVKNNFQQNEIIFFHDLNNKYLINLYRKAIFYIFSSYCEVFGLTSLEAMSQGCPVIISNKSALPEINNSAAEYFDPDNIGQIKESMNKVLLNKNYRLELINKGKIHCKKFSWEKTVSETIKILKN